MNVRGARYLQAIRGPILLMLVGLLFAVQQAGVISITRTWPILVIAIGILKLLERMVAPPGPPYAGGPV
jgi:uncharacterized membrane protein